MKLIKKAYNWFERDWGWFFVNGRKREDWDNYIKTKYYEGNRTNDTI